MRQKGPTMADIAKLSGVSQSTVSLVLNQKGGSAIPPETVERVQAAARKLHYVKAPRSRTAPEKTSRSVLALATDMTNPYYAVMLHELDLAAASSLASTLKGRVMVNAGDKPYLLVRAKPGQNPVQVIEEALGAMEQK